MSLFRLYDEAKVDKGVRLNRLFLKCFLLSFVLIQGGLVSEATAQDNGFGGLLPAPGKKKERSKTDKKQTGKKAKKTKPKKRIIKKTRKRGVRAMFEEAQRLFKSGKYEQAIVAYDNILKRYPAHTPSSIQIAKSLYRLDRVKDAYKVFARINPQLLDPETSYEYGWSFFKSESWEGALYAFKRIPKGHALYDLANYYGGVSAIKLRRYEEAEDLLERAVVLPDKLAKSHKIYLKNVAILKLMQQKQDLNEEKKREQERLSAEANKESPAAPVKDEGPKEYEHKGKKGIAKLAKVSVNNAQQTFDYHGFRESTYQSQTAKLTLLSGFMFPIPVKQDENQAATGLQLTMIVEDRNTKGEERRIIIDEQADDLTRVLSSDPTRTHSKAGKVAAEIFAEFPLPENVWFAIGGEIFFSYPDFERGNRGGTRKAYSDLAGSQSGIDFSTTLAYTEVLNNKTEPLITITGISGSVKKSFEHKFSAYLKGGYDSHDYLNESLPLSGPDAVTTIKIGGSQGFPFSIKISGELGFQYQANYTVFGLPTYGQVGADGQVLHGKAEIFASPFPWLSLKLKETIQRTTWEVELAEAQETFELNTPNYLEDFSAEVGLNLAF